MTVKKKKKCLKKSLHSKKCAKKIPGTCSIETRGKMTTIVCDRLAARKVLSVAQQQTVPDEKINSLAQKAAKAWKRAHDGLPMGRAGFNKAYRVAHEEISRYLGIEQVGKFAADTKKRFEEALSMALIDHGTSLDFAAFEPKRRVGSSKRTENVEDVEDVEEIETRPSAPVSRDFGEEIEPRPSAPVFRDFGETNYPRPSDPGFPFRRDFGESNEPPMTNGAYGYPTEPISEDFEMDRERFYSRASDGLHRRRRRSR
jgi:hypothetical protein